MRLRSTTWIALYLLLAPAAVQATPEPPPQPPPQPPPAAIQIRPAPPPAAEKLAAMRTWHRAYAAEMRPVRRALGLLLRHLGSAEGRRITEPCRRLQAALERLDEEAVLPVPDFATDTHLRAALAGLGRAAGACLGGRTSAVGHHLRRAGAGFLNAELALRPYGLRP